MALGQGKAMINRQIIWSIVSAIAGSVLFGQSVLAQSLPQYSDSNHLGVASCASSTCHAAATLNERVSILEFRQYLQSQLLRDADATSMRHSLEVRPPLVDRELVRALACIPPKLRQATPAKRMLREAARPPVPDALWNRQKHGFTLPFEDWLRSGKIGLELPDHPCLDGDAVRRVAADFERGRLHWSRLWALLVLGEFLR